MVRRSDVSTLDWDLYLKWNTAIADAMFPVCDEADPVYMDLDEEEFQRIAGAVGYAGTDHRSAFRHALRAVVIDAEAQLQLQPLRVRTEQWMKSRRKDPPPCLAFLAGATLAAEDMGSQSGLSANAYYVPLARVLGLADANRAVRQQYPRHAEFFWRCLNTWLEGLEGERGLPTAYALAHRYVGLPMSQALIRESDRRRLHVMFAQSGLSPGMQLSPDDLTWYLEKWIKAEGSSASANLRRLWTRTATHERIASVASVELANWDGIVEGGGAAEVQAALTSRAVVVANLRKGFFDSTLDLSLGIRPTAEATSDGRMEVQARDGSWLRISFDPSSTGLCTTAYTQAIDFGSMLDGLVVLRHVGSQDGRQYKHLPRSVIPLVYDERQAAFVEAEQVQLGADGLLLVLELARTRHSKVIDEVERALASSARPGYQRFDAFDGLPDGWILFTDVQFFGAPDTELSELVPLGRNQLTVAGGLRIPSRIRGKWSTLNPPEIRAAVQDEARIRVELTESNSERVIGEWTSYDGALVAPLSGRGLDDGDYQVSLFLGLREAPTQQIQLRLRSSESRDDSMWAKAPRLTYDLAAPIGALTASEADSDAFVDGQYTAGDSGIEQSVDASEEVVWIDPPAKSERTKIRIGEPDPNSCIVTGAHNEQLPTYYGGRGPKFISGVCKYCGRVKRYRGWLPSLPRSNPSAPSPGSATSQQDQVFVRHLRPIEDEAGPRWDAAFDALMHMGGGSMGLLELVAKQIEGSALFVDTFLRSLETLGHIAVERDSNWNPIRWEVSPACLAQDGGGAYRLTGSWPRSVAMGIAARAHELGGHMRSGRRPSEPSLTSIEGLGESVEDLTDTCEVDVTVVPDSGFVMLEALPRLSTLAESLPRVSMSGFERAESFDVHSASWAPAAEADTTGLFRLYRGFETLYVFRTSRDISDGSAARIPVFLGKHLATNVLGTNLLMYQSAERRVIVPLGCDLPGLYGRAAVAISGSLPDLIEVKVKEKPRKCLSYKNFSKSAADQLATLLST
jgi:hypothetical protein